MTDNEINELLWQSIVFVNVCIDETDDLQKLLDELKCKFAEKKTKVDLLMLNHEQYLDQVDYQTLKDVFDKVEGTIEYTQQNIWRNQYNMNTELIRIGILARMFFYERRN